MELITKIGAFAGLVAFFGLALLALLAFTQARDIRRLREWAGSAPERDADKKESTSVAASQRAEELKRLEEAREAERQAANLREERRQRREAGLPEVPWGERMRERFSGGGSLGAPRYLVALFAVALVVGGGVAYAALHGFGGDEGGKNGSGAASTSEIEVAVLNGTAEAGLAATYGDQVERKGFDLGKVDNSDSAFEESIVMFKRGSAPEARRVAKALEISQVELMTSEIAAASGGAKVSVIVGEDNASSAP
ncbi:MAG: LytR C-terminal domain-containing protein [Solirubrobacterales bacterium]